MLRLYVLIKHYPLIFGQWQWIILYGSIIVSLIYSLDYTLLKYDQGQGLSQCHKPLATLVFGVVQNMF